MRDSDTRRTKMPYQSHQDRPEIWFRPSPRIPLTVLSELITRTYITATPRLGARNDNHPKGYKQGEVAMLRVFDEANVEHLSRRIRIEAVIVRPLQQLLPADLHRTFSYRNWEEVQRELSFFEKRMVESDEDASIIEFSYL
ncbi:MAG: hypothetical protein ACYCPH_02220 [Minisyncoccota bacterium]